MGYLLRARQSFLENQNSKSYQNTNNLEINNNNTNNYYFFFFQMF